MQTKIADFSKIPSFMKFLLEELKSLKNEGSEWYTSVQTTITKLKEEYDIVVSEHRRRSSHLKSDSLNFLHEYREKIAVPYLDSLIENINQRFKDEAVKVLSAAAIFDPAKFPTEESQITSYGLEEINTLADYYGNDASVEYDGTIHTSPAVLDREELLSEWETFRRALIQEKASVVHAKET